MKKFLAIILAVLMLVSFAACGSDDSDSKTKDTRKFYDECGVIQTFDSFSKNAELVDTDDKAYKYSVGKDEDKAEDILEDYIDLIKKADKITVKEIQAFKDGDSYAVSYNDQQIGYIVGGMSDGEYFVVVLFTAVVSSDGTVEVEHKPEYYNENSKIEKVDSVLYLYSNVKYVKYDSSEKRYTYSFGTDKNESTDCLKTYVAKIMNADGVSVNTTEYDSIFEITVNGSVVGWIGVCTEDNEHYVLIDFR